VKPHRIIGVVACLLGVFALSGIVLAQGGGQPGAAPKVQAELDRARVAVGDWALLTITLDGVDADSTPVAPTVPGLHIQYLDVARSSQTFLSIVNGRQSSRTMVTVQYRYRVEPMRSGRFDIPPFPVVVGGQTVMTPELTVIAAEPGPNPDYLVEVEVQPQEAFVGEPVLLRTTWFVSTRVSDFTFSLPGLERLKVSDAPDPRPPGTHPQDPDFQQFRFLGGMVYGIQAEVEYKGRRFTAVTLDRIVTASEPGSYTLGPMRVAFDAADTRSGSSIGVFPGRAKRIVIASNPVTLTVKPLPEEGRPPGFDGLVGEYTLSAVAAPTAVRAGDPIELSWRVTGTVTADTVPPMVLTSQRELADRFRVPVEPVVPRVQGKDAVFGATIRARQGVTRIPALTLSVFDTKSKQYKVLKSQPIDLDVAPGGIVSSDEPAVTAADEPERAAAIEPIDRSPHAVDVDGLLGDRWALVAAVAPVCGVMLGVAGVLASRRWSREPSVRARAAARRAVRDLRRIEPARADAADRAAAALRRFESRLRRLDAERAVLAEVERHIDRLDRGRFGGRHLSLERAEVEQMTAAVRAAAGKVGVDEPAAPRVATGVSSGAAPGGAVRAGVWGLVAVGALSLLAGAPARAAEGPTALDNLRSAEAMAVSDPGQAKALAATAIDELLAEAQGPAGRTAALHKALARAYVVTGDTGRRDLALRRAARLSPWLSMSVEEPERPGTAPAAPVVSAPTASTAAIPLAWAGYVRVVSAPVRLGVLAAAWTGLWLLIGARLVMERPVHWMASAIGLAAAVTVLAAAGVGLDMAQTWAQRDEVMIVKAVTPRTGPDDVVFAPAGSVLAPGTLVRAVEDGPGEPGWMRVRPWTSGGKGDGAGEAVWIPAGTAERVVR
jgi:hypothetical protein